MSELNFNNIYYLGPNGSNSHNAMLNILKSENINVENHIPLKSIKMVFEALLNDENSICVLPIENSIEGIVRETIDNLAHTSNTEIKIQGEITLPIKHLLLSKGNDKSKIKVIMSHPQALSQCSSYLHNEFNNAELKETTSTSLACEEINKLNDETFAAIANETCASLFELNILSSDINDEKDNKTRFYLLSRKSFKNNNNDKTALIVSTKNEPGALCNVLKVIENNNINLSYIDSRPSKKALGEYIFFMELEKMEQSQEVQNALKELPPFVNYTKILGSYKKYN